MNYAPICAGCKEPVNPGADLCPRCGHRLRPRLGILSHPIAALVVVGMCLALAVGLVLEIQARQRFRKAAEGAERPGERALLPGDMVVLERPGGEDVYLAMDVATIGSMVEALQSANRESIHTMVKAGKVIVVPNGTTAKVVEAVTSSKRVQIMARPHYGSQAWLPTTDVRPRRPVPINLPSRP